MSTSKFSLYRQHIIDARQLIYALLDQEIHSITSDITVDTAEVYARLLFNVMELRANPNTNPTLLFAHIVRGYSAAYYGYMWSDVYSADMFATRFSKNILDPEVGRDYRKCILEPGGEKDAIEQLRAFLGRDPSNIPYLKDKGLAINEI